MPFATISATTIPIWEQHSFLDLAKEFEWESVKDLVKRKPSLVHVQPCGRAGGKRWSALHQAAYSGNSDAVRFLIKFGASLDLETDDGKTPLQVAKNAHIRSLLQSFSTDETGLAPAPAVLTSVIGKDMKKSKALKTKVAKTSKKLKTKIAKGKRAKRLVFKGKFDKTSGGLSKSQLVKSKTGKIVSKRMQEHGMSSYSHIKRWVDASMTARADLGLTGFVALKKGCPLYIKTMEIYCSQS